MRKIRLDLDALEVDSFPVAADGKDDRGTVHGRGTLYVCSEMESCPGLPSCLGDPTCASACSETNGVAICKSCGPCCYE
jgi:hypothetical protein